MKYAVVRIDPLRKVVEDLEIECTPDDEYGLKDIHRLVGTEELGHLMADKQTQDWHDDLGLLRGPWKDMGFFRCPWYSVPMCGVHVLTGSVWKIDQEGLPTDYPADVKVTATMLRPHIEWVDPRDVVIPAPTVNGVPTGPDWTYDNQPR